MPFTHLRINCIIHRPVCFSVCRVAWRTHCQSDTDSYTADCSLLANDSDADRERKPQLAARPENPQTQHKQQQHEPWLWLPFSQARARWLPEAECGTPRRHKSSWCSIPPSFWSRRMPFQTNPQKKLKFSNQREREAGVYKELDSRKSKCRKGNVQKSLPSST